MGSCTLCDLPTPDPPITSSDTDGVFCCKGCLEIHKTLDSPGTDGEDKQQEGSRSQGEEHIDSEGLETGYLRIDGMHCSACEKFIETSVEKYDGIVGVDASYSSELVKLVYDPDRVQADELTSVVERTGYNARMVDSEVDGGSRGSVFRLVVGGHLGMMAMVWYVVFLYPEYFNMELDPSWTFVDSGPLGMSSLMNIWLLATAVLLVTGYPILRGAYVSLRSGQPNMDLLVALAAVNAYVFSSLVMFSGGTEVYFDITVVIVLVVTLGNYYEKSVKRKAVGMLAGFTGEEWGNVRRLGEEGEEKVEIDDVESGDEVLVKPGERVPIDGRVVSGRAAVDESLISGESIPVHKGVGDEVVGGSIVTDNAVVVRAGEDLSSTIDRLMDLFWDIQSAKPGVQRYADRLATVFVPLVLVLAALAFGWRFALGAPFDTALLTGLALLVVSCPCALGLATPLAVAMGLKEGLKRGVVVKNGSVFEAGGVDVLAFDKTGTLTKGEMEVVSFTDREAVRKAAAVEQYSNHPIAKAITRHTDPPDLPVTEFTEHTGMGVSGYVDDEHVLIGNPELFREYGWRLPSEVSDSVDAVGSSGNIPVVVGWGGRARSVIAVGDRIREDWRVVVERLSDVVGRIVVVTGDSASAVEEFEDCEYVDRVFTGVRPEAKVEVVNRLGGTGRTAMVGDGNNDAPALAAADIGIALGGTALATDAADVVVREDDLNRLMDVFSVVGGARSRIRQNIGWAFLYNGVAVPLAFFGLINPLFAAIAMATSSLLVTFNSTRKISAYF